MRLSQTNVTAEPADGLQFAAAAYYKGRQPEAKISDPTAAGEAAAKAGLRAVQLNAPLSDVTDWFDRSYEALGNETLPEKRERVATHLLEGRSLALSLVRDDQPSADH
ncbi:MAG: hypothetical protein ACREGF_01510 [Candidatus Saccharimonadales bacterium]